MGDLIKYRGGTWDAGAKHKLHLLLSSLARLHSFILPFIPSIRPLTGSLSWL